MKTGCTEILQLRIYRDSSVNKFSTLFANLNLYENKVFRKYLESVLNTFIKTVWYSVFLSFTDGFLIFFISIILIITDCFSSSYVAQYRAFQNYSKPSIFKMSGVSI